MVRAANLFDVPAMVRIDRAVHQSLWTYRFFMRHLRGPYRTWVLRHNRQVLAFAVVQIHASYLVVLNMAVAPFCQRRGYGRALLMQVIGKAKQLGLQAVYVEVATNNQQAFLFYKQCHFYCYVYLRGYYEINGVYVDAWRMQLELDG